MSDNKILLEKCKAIEDKVVEMRHILHAIPEIGGDLPQTRKFVREKLDELQIPYRLNQNDDGLIAEIKGAKEGKMIAFRADMDGLYVTEEADVAYKSVIPGQMHACGHDAHTAMLLAAAEILNQHKDELCGTVRLLFQSGEETGTGAKMMLAEGALDGVDAICGIHVGNVAGDLYPTGSIVAVPGPVSAGKHKFTITVKGKSTHSAFPERGVDPILIAARIVNACEELSARELSVGTPALLSFGSFQAGVEHNAIPDTAVLKGGIRAQDVRVRDFLADRMKCICENIAAAFRAECDVNIVRGSATVMNDENLAEFAGEALINFFGDGSVYTKTPYPLMGSDDFANYASQIPGLYFFLCTNNSEKGITQPNHNSSFDVDEDVLWKGVAAYVALAVEYLKA